MYPEAHTLQYMREAFEARFPAACTIYRATDSAVDTTPYVWVEETVCKVQLSDPLATPFTVTPTEIGDSQLRWLKLPWSANVQVGREIDVGPNTYAILDTSTDDTNPLLIVAKCNKIAQPATRPDPP